jgi:hypothetical protein
MKITSRVLTDAVLAANQSALADYPSGLRVVGPDGNGLYSMQLIPRKTGAHPPVILCYGPPREAYVAMQAVLAALPVVRGIADGKLSVAASSLVDSARRREGQSKQEYERDLAINTNVVLSLIGGAK